jgi:hypothetical protein
MSLSPVVKELKAQKNHVLPKQKPHSFAFSGTKSIIFVFIFVINVDFSIFI